MTNIKRQHYLDKKKYIKSEKFGSDFSGNMDYCGFCGFQRDNLTCPISQLDREMNCLCATAYNKMIKERTKK
jgi:hypothetical protein